MNFLPTGQFVYFRLLITIIIRMHLPQTRFLLNYLPEIVSKILQQQSQMDKRDSTASWRKIPSGRPDKKIQNNSLRSTQLGEASPTSSNILDKQRNKQKTNGRKPSLSIHESKGKLMVGAAHDEYYGMQEKTLEISRVNEERRNKKQNSSKSFRSQYKQRRQTDKVSEASHPEGDDFKINQRLSKQKSPFQRKRQFQDLNPQRRLLKVKSGGKLLDSKVSELNRKREYNSKQKNRKTSEIVAENKRTGSKHKSLMRQLTASSIAQANPSFFKQIKCHIRDQMHLQQEQWGAQILRQRFRCLDMLGRICHSMVLKRQNFMLASAYLDKFIDSRTQLPTIKTAAIASLMIALKVEHCQSYGWIQYQTANSEENYSRISAKTCSDSLDRPPSSTKIKRSYHKPQLPNVLTVILSHGDIFSDYDRIVGRQDINDMELHILAKLNFRFETKSLSLWVEILSEQWNEFLKAKGLLELPTIRNKAAKILSVLSQINQILLPPYPKPVVALSLMYLLIRIYSEYPKAQREAGFSYLRSQLSKSVNVLFRDQKGVNTAFGLYLDEVGVDFGEMMECCQYVSRFFEFEFIMSVIARGKKQNVKQYFAQYTYSPELFRFISSYSHY